MQYPFTEIHPLTTKVIRLPEGDRHVLTVNAKGFPVDWPNLYCTISLRTSSMALATMQTHATAVCMLHNWCGDRGISLQQKFMQSQGDYRVAKYSAVNLHAKIGNDVFRLKTTNKTKFVSPRG